MMRFKLMPIYLVVLVGTLFCGVSFISCGGSGNDKTANNNDPIDTTPPVVCTNDTPPTPGYTFFLDPVNGRNDNAGTLSEPWGALASVVADNMIETRVYANLPMTAPMRG